MLQSTVPPPTQTPPPAVNPYAACTQLAQSHYENFPVGRLVPKNLRHHVHAVYAFARVADNNRAAIIRGISSKSHRAKSGVSDCEQKQAESGCEAEWKIEEVCFHVSPEDSLF